MAQREICIYPDDVLRQKTIPVTEFSRPLHTLLDDMRETMYAAHGVGLAAPQIGELVRVTVIDVSDSGNEPLEFINPVITAREGNVPSEEGCLSIPDFRETITRSERITVDAVDRNGAPFQVQAEGLLAICLQHELDHLEGILFIDHLSRLKRDVFKKKWGKRI
ncbi:MAG: peptide deformylase [Bdellovibrionota bacterium]|jgi:peptide deformylase